MTIEYSAKDDSVQCLDAETGSDLALSPGKIGDNGDGAEYVDAVAESLCDGLTDEDDVVDISIETVTDFENAGLVEYKKYDTYDLKVDPLQDDRATEIKFLSVKRPHMRAFHFAWWCYHCAFLMWFSITPLLGEVQDSLGLSKEQIWTSSIAAVSGTIFMRFILGPFCDKFGPRIPMGLVLIAAGIPTAMTGLVSNATGLTIIRFFIGMGGSTFVMCQYWTSRMFTKQLVGTTNATAAGWGNLGGGVTQVLVGTIIFPVLKNMVFSGSEEERSDRAWRTACIFPAILGLVTGVCVIFFSDDAPKGNYAKFKKRKQMAPVSVVSSFADGAMNYNTWLLFIQYACCFGVEITMNNAAALYFREKFGMSTAQAAAYASIFGWMNIFARGLGGFVSDRSNAKMGMKGRLLWQSTILLLEGVMVVAFAFTETVPAAVAVLVFFSIFVQGAEGSTYGVVPYVNPLRTGSVSGIVGAGGNTGAVLFSLFFRQLSFKQAFIAMGVTIICSSCLSFFIQIKGHQTFLFSEVVDEREKNNKRSSHFTTETDSDSEENLNNC